MPTFNNIKIKNCKAAVLSLWLYADMNAAIKLHSSFGRICDRLPRSTEEETFSHR